MSVHTDICNLYGLTGAYRRKVPLLFSGISLELYRGVVSIFVFAQSFFKRLDCKVNRFSDLFGGFFCGNDRAFYFDIDLRAILDISASFVIEDHVGVQDLVFML